MSMKVEDFLRTQCDYDVMRYVLYTYRIGQPIMEDSGYEAYKALLKESIDPRVQELLSLSYDDLPVPVDVLELLGEKPVEFASKDGQEDLFRYLDKEKSNSIDSVVDDYGSWEFFDHACRNHLDVMVSTKKDGVNTKSLFLDDELRLSVSRGRNGIGFEWTETIGRVLPRKMATGIHEIKVYTEAYVDNDYLLVLRKNFDPDGYKTAKSAALSLLRVSHAEECYEHLRVKVFFAEGLVDTTLDEMFRLLEDLGMETVEHKLIRWQEIPTDFENFHDFVEHEIFDYISAANQGAPSDGVVAEINDLSYSGDVHGIYNTRQIALKYEPWKFKFYSGIVKKILWTQKRVYASCRLQIKPMQTDDGCNATYVNCFNHRILVENGILPSSRIYFERNSNAVNILLYGETLDAARRGERQ